MADNSVNIGINVSDNGSTEKVTKNVKNLKDVIDQTVAAAAKLGMSGGTPAPRMAGGGSVPPSGGGAAAIASGGAARPPGGAASTQAEYGALRGVASSTGASARDFAKESEGMNGLVRVYATFAATTYTVAAAFTALSKAMDTTNMVQGLNQLGAASGVSLGNLSKRVVDATDGAVSLKQAMQSVAQASAAGISSDNILKLTDGAKKASQALGIDMSDALSRIMRGVTKLEPELLDELGIFTKLDESSKKYALTLGKSVSALTDFEKRQGFALAVQEEVNKKFGDLKIEANPYSKLLATFQDLAQTGLELINKVIGPIIGLLANSPMALAGVLTYIGVNLLAKTIPALGKWQDSLKNAAEQAKNTSEAITKTFDDKFQTNLESRFKLPGLKQSLADSQKEFDKLSAATVVGPMAPAPKTLGTSATAAGMDAKGLSTINDLLATRNTRLETGYAGAAKLSANQVQATKDEIKWLEIKAKAIEHEIALTAAAGKVSKDKAAIDIAQTKIGVIADNPIGKLDPQTIALKQAETARLNFEKLSAVAAASETASVNGVRAAWAQLGNTIQEKGITGIDKYTTLAKGGLAAVATRLTGIISAFGVWGQIAAAGIAVFEVFDSFASKNTKEAEATTKALSVVKDAVTTLGDTMDNIGKKGFLGSITTEARNATATAITNLVTSTQDAIDKAGKELLAANWWDTLKDKISMIWGGDTATKVATATATTISKVLKAAEEGDAKQEALTKLSALLKIDASDAEALEKKLISADKALGKSSLDITNQLSKNLQEAASAAAELDEAFKNASKTYDTILVSAIPTDPLAKLGQEMMILGEKMQKAAKDPITAIDQLAKISTDTSKLRFINPEVAKDLVNRADAINRLKQTQLEYNKSVKESPDVTAPANNANAVFSMRKKSNVGLLSTDTASGAAREIATKAEQAQLLEAANQAGIGLAAPVQKLLNSTGAKMFSDGSKLIQDSIAKGFAQGRAILTAAYTTRLGDTDAGIKARAQLAREEIDRSIVDLKAKAGLIDAQEELRKTVELNTIETALNTLELSKLPEEGKGGKADKRDKLTKEQLRLSDPAAYAKEFGKGEPSKALTSMELAKLALQAEIFKAEQSKKAIDKKEEDEQAARVSRRTAEQLDASNKIIASKKEYNKLVESGLPYISEGTILLQQSADKEAERNADLKESQGIRDEIAATERTINELGGKGKNRTADDTKNFNRALSANLEYSKKLATLEETQAAQRVTNDRKREEELRTGAANKFAFEQTLATRSLEISQANDKAQAAANETTINKLKDAGVNAAIALAAFQADLDKKTEKERLAATLAELQTKKDLEVKAKTDIRDKTATGTAERGIAETDLNSVTARYDALIAGEKAVSASKQVNLDIASRQNIEAAIQAKLIADQKSAMNDLIPIAENLAGVFGDVGKKFGDGMIGILKATQDAATNRLEVDKKYAQDRRALEIETAASIAALAGEGSDEDILKAKEKGDADKLKLDKKYAKDSANLEFAKNDSIIKNAKGMFSEKTFAYKAIAAIEKTMHIVKMGMNIAEMISDNTKTGVSLANSATRTAGDIVEAGVKGVKAVISAIADLPFPFDLAAGAAVATVVGSLLSSIGGTAPKTASTAGSTSADRQSLGAGQKFVNGAKVDTGGGVFGDPTAKSESIIKSIEILNATQVEGLSYDNKMVQLLTSINQNIGKAAIGIYGTVGLSKGSALGTKEGTSGFSIFGSFLSSSTTKQILDSGIKLAGNFKAVMDNLKGTIAGFETTLTTTKNSFLGFSWGSSAVRDATIELEDSVSTSISEIFKNAGKLFIESGAKLGVSAEDTIAKLGNIDVTKLISLRGLKGDDLEKEFNSIISGILDDTTRGLFANLTKFQKFGEGMLQTVTRVIDTNEKINLSLNSIGLAGLNASGVLTESSIAITQAMADAAGGLDKFLEHVKFFADNFLTEAERLTPITAKVTASMTDITRIAKEQGFIAKDAEGIVDTKAEFKSLYLTLSQNTTPAAIELRHQLDLVSESFIKVTAQYEDLIKQVSDANTESATKFMSESEKLIFTRNKERDAIAETNKPLFDLITTLKLASLDLDKATQALLDGFKNVTTAADTAKAALLSAAKSGLTNLEAAATSARTALATLVTEGLKALEDQLNTLKGEVAKTATDGFRLLETEAINAKAAIGALATEGLRAFETAVNDAKNALASAVTEGLRAFEAKVTELKDNLASLATEGLRLLETELANTKASIAALATDGLRAFEAAANDAKASIAELATKGLGAFEAVLEDTKNKLKDTIFNGFDLLTTKLTGLQSDLESLGTDGFNKLKGGVDNVKNSIKESYKAAVEAQKNASKAFIDSLKTVGTGIKDFLKTVAGGDLGIADQATKYKALRTEFDKTLKLAKAGDEIALGKLPQLSQDLLTAAKEQSSTKLEYARTFADVTSQLGDISAVLDTKIQTAEKDAADGVAALETSSLSTADALKLANDELAKWTDAIEKSGVAVEIKAEADAKLQLSTASGALTALDTARTSLNTWLDLIGSDAAAVLTKTDPATLTELKATFATLRTNIADVNTTINTYIKDNNEILKTAGYTGTDLLKNLPVTLTVANTKTQIAATVKLLKDADDAVVGYIAGTKTFLASKEGGGFTAEEIDRILKRTDSPLTTANTNDKLNALKKILKDADDAIIGYIAKTATFLASKEGGGFTAEEIDKILKRTDSPLTKENTQDKLDAAVKSLKDADYALIKYISGTTEFLNNNGFSAAEIDKILKRTDSPLTKENTKDKLVEAAGKLTAAENAVTSYINGSTEFLKTHGFSQEEIDKILKRTDSPFTIENTGNKINAAVKALKDSEDALTKYIGGTVEFLTTHGFSQEEIDKILKRTESPLTKENTQDKLNAAVLVLNAAETAITKYITDITTFLRNNGFSQEEIDKILKRTESPLTKENTKDKLATAVGVLKDADNAIIAYIAGMKTFLADKANGGFSPEEIDKILKRTDSPLTIVNTKDKFDAAVKAIKDAETAIVTYIAGTNTILTTAGFSADELLKRTNILSLDATVTDAKKKYDDAVIEVGKWADKLKELGVSFTPYGSPADVGLTALAGKFTTAQTAFNTANTAITDWVGKMTSLVNSISLPGVPVIPPVAVPVVTAPGTGTNTGTVTRTHERPPAPGSNYTWNQTGPNADDGYWSYYQMEIGGTSGGFALGGAFDYGNMMKFAAGDSFSNSIVDKPTKFRMGLMGEAGPEAIMPLTRGPDGSLGVTAQMPDFGNSNEANMVLVNEIKELRNEVAKLRVIASQNEYNTRKTKETLQLVTVGGEYMQTKSVT